LRWKEVKKVDKEAIGKRLRELRGVFRTQAEVSEATGIDRTKLSRYENGLSIPTDADKLRLASYYAMSVEQLFFMPEDDTERVLESGGKHDTDR
jgi:transcriptional regulator with XRE-family HTH domain